MCAGVCMCLPNSYLNVARQQSEPFIVLKGLFVLNKDIRSSRVARPSSPFIHRIRNTEKMFWSNSLLFLSQLHSVYWDRLRETHRDSLRENTHTHVQCVLGTRRHSAYINLCVARALITLPRRNRAWAMKNMSEYALAGCRGPVVPNNTAFLMKHLF